MKKVIELNLTPEDIFFLRLKNRFLEIGEFGIGYDVRPVVKQIVAATIQTLKEELKEQTPNVIGAYNFTFEHKENVYPHFHNALEHNIDIALNKKIHTTTLERFSDVVEKFMVEFSDQQVEDKKVKVSSLVNPEKELEAIINYVNLTWNGFDKVNAPEFFNKIWTEVTELTKNKFSQYSFTNLAIQLREDFPAGSKEMNGEFHCSEMPLGILLGTSELSSMVNTGWDYERSVNRVLAEVKKEFPDASSLRPKGWYEMSKDYKAFEGMDNLNDQEIIKQFKGMNSEGAGSHGFETRVSLPHVMYDSKCQGRKPLETLVGAILGHAYAMVECNNNSKMLKEWLDFSKKMKTSITPYEFKEPLNQALNAIIESKDYSANNAKALEILGIEPSAKKKFKY